jgi:hypothetical protein
MTERVNFRLMEFNFLISPEQPWHCPRCCSHVDESSASNSPSKKAWRTSSHSEQGPTVLTFDSGAGRKIMAIAPGMRRDGQLAPGLTVTLPFMFGWIEHR